MADRRRSSYTLGGIIRRQRELAELPMRQLAAMVGISNPYLSQIERGLRAPSGHVLNAIAASLRTTADALLAEADPGASVTAPVLDAIAEDPNLTSRQRLALAEVYESMAEATIGRRRRDRREPDVKRPGD